MAFNSEIKGYMTFGKSFSRGGAFPLEAYEIWTDYDALVAYAANTDPAKDPSYIGQKVSYIDTKNNKVIHYGIEIDGTLKEIGVAPLGDGKTVTVTADGVISLLGADAAESLTLPRMNEAKTGIEWVRVSEIVEGDGNDNTTYTFTELSNSEGETYGFIVKTFFNGQEVSGGTIEIAFDVYTKKEVDAAIKVVADKIGVAASGQTGTLYELIAAEVSRATSAESALSDRIGVKAEDGTAASGVYAYIDGVIDTIVNGVDPNKIDSLNELIAWVDAHPAIVEELDDRLDAVENAIKTLNGDATTTGSVDKKIVDAIEAENLDQYATKQEITNAGYAVKSEVANTYATKQFVGSIPAEASSITIVDYINEKAQEVLDSATGGSSESAASVKQQLDSYKAANDPKVNALLAEVYGEGQTDYTADSRIDALEQADAEQDTLIANNKTLAQKGVDDAAAAQSTANTALQNTNNNTTLIENLTKATTGGDEGDTSSLAYKIGQLQAHNMEHANEFATLKGRVDANEETLKDKANSSDVYTKAQIGTFDTTETTIVKMISDETARAKTAEQANASAIEKEIARATAAENKNSTAITTVADDVETINKQIAVINGSESTEGSMRKIAKDAALAVETAAMEFMGAVNQLPIGLTETDKGHFYKVTADIDLHEVNSVYQYNKEATFDTFSTGESPQFISTLYFSDKGWTSDEPTSYLTTGTISSSSYEVQIAPYFTFPTEYISSGTTIEVPKFSYTIHCRDLSDLNLETPTVGEWKTYTDIPAKGIKEDAGTTEFYIELHLTNARTLSVNKKDDTIVATLNSISVFATSPADSTEIKKGDSIVWDGSVWYVIPSGDDIEDTWRPVTIAGTALTSTQTLAINAGNNINIIKNGNAFEIAAIINQATGTTAGTIAGYADSDGNTMIGITDGKINAVSTDLLVNGSKTLILNGGSATV